MLISRFDMATTVPDYSLAYEWDIVMRRTPFEDA
jgi:hypothetical protein